MTLDHLRVGESARVTAVGGKGALRQHILDMGVIPGSVVTLTKLAPLGDPMELKIHGYALSLRKADAARIEVEPASAEKPVQAPPEPHENEHPGYGEGGRYHDKTHENALPEDTTLTFALIFLIQSIMTFIGAGEGHNALDEEDQGKGQR